MDAGTRPEAPLTCQRDAFSLPDDLHYLNCAYMGPLPRVSEDAGIEGLRVKRVPSDIVPDDFFNTADELRGLFAGLVGAPDPQRISIGPGASYALAAAAKNLPLETGQNLVLTSEQFPGNVHAWTRKAREASATVRTVGPGEGSTRGATWNDRILTSIDSRTAIVSVPTVHWTDGTLFDLIVIGSRCREVGAALVIDATQSIGAMPFDVTEVQPDLVVCSTYKWLLGPYSLALAYFGPRFDDGVPLEETWIGRERSEDFQHLVDYQDGYQPGAIRYDVAERSNFALLPVAVASLELLTGWGAARIQGYCRELTADLLESAGELGFSVEAEQWRGAHLFGLRMPEGIDLSVLRDGLAARRVSVSLRGTALRLAPNVYNDASDVEALLDGLREAVGG